MITSTRPQEQPDESTAFHSPDPALEPSSTVTVPPHWSKAEDLAYVRDRWGECDYADEAWTMYAYGNAHLHTALRSVYTFLLARATDTPTLTPDSLILTNEELCLFCLALFHRTPLEQPAAERLHQDLLHCARVEAERRRWSIQSFTRELPLKVHVDLGEAMYTASHLLTETLRIECSMNHDTSAI